MKGGKEFVLKNEFIHYFTIVDLTSCLKHSCLNEVEKRGKRKALGSEEEKEGEGGFANLKRGFPQVRTVLILKKGI